MFKDFKSLFLASLATNLIALSFVITFYLATRTNFLADIASYLGLANTVQTAPTNQIYWGALINHTSTGTSNDSPWDLVYSGGDTTGKFETAAGKGVAIIHWGQPWYNSTSWPNGYYPFSPTLMNAVRAHGSIPLLDWGSWDLGNGTPNQPNFALKNIAAGNYSFGGQTFDQYVTSFAQAAKTWGHPFFLRFDWEMNGWWQFPWSVQLNGNTPTDYINAWRHVHDIFSQVGATNVTWVWCPNIASSGTTSSTPFSQVYPGDSYVDWTCLDGYNQPGSWIGFNTVFTGSGTTYILNSYQQLLTLAPSKPIMIGETASYEAGDGGAKKAAWETDALTLQLPTNFPQIKAVVWFNWNDNNPNNTYPIESTLTTQSSFASGIDTPYFAANTFSNLAGGIIQPLVNPTTTPTPVPSVASSPTIIPIASPVPTNNIAPTPKVTLSPTPVSSTNSPFLGACFSKSQFQSCDAYCASLSPSASCAGNYNPWEYMNSGSPDCSTSTNKCAGPGCCTNINGNKWFAQCYCKY